MTCYGLYRVIVVHRNDTDGRVWINYSVAENREQAIADTVKRQRLPSGYAHTHDVFVSFIGPMRPPIS